VGSLKAVVPLVETAEVDYLARGEAGTLFEIAATNGVGVHLSTAEIERIYNGTFVRSARTRTVYASLKKAAVNDICPLCGQGTVRQLDHYLPITQFPTFGLSACNLVPSCSDCNKNKLTHVSKTAGDQTIHPYFDEMDDARWLFAEVVEGAPAALSFFVEAPQVWDETKAHRIATHFRVYRLAELYATYAAVELTNLRFSLERMAAARVSIRTISEHLSERAEDWAHVHKNTWQRSTFDALAKSEWYCSGGFSVG
jgi:hypothetical protein